MTLRFIPAASTQRGQKYEYISKRSEAFMRISCDEIWMLRKKKRNNFENWTFVSSFDACVEEHVIKFQLFQFRDKYGNLHCSYMSSSHFLHCEFRCLASLGFNCQISASEFRFTMLTMHQCKWLQRLWTQQIHVNGNLPNRMQFRGRSCEWQMPLHTQWWMINNAKLFFFSFVMHVGMLGAGNITASAFASSRTRVDNCKIVFSICTNY